METKAMPKNTTQELMVILERCLICRFFEGVRKKSALCPLDVCFQAILGVLYFQWTKK